MISRIRPSTLAAGFAMVIALAGPASGREQPGEFEPSAQAIHAHMEFLASDLLEGREAGTRGYDLASAYVAAAFRELGLTPAGDSGGYLQAVPLTAYRPSGEGRIALVGPKGERVPLVFGEDYLPQPNPLAPDAKVAAPLVFAGYGVVSPERGRDDYAGLDVKGKVVVVLGGAPKAFQTEERAHYGGSRVKRAAALARGAVGLIVVNTPTGERLRPFRRNVAHWREMRMTWRDAEGRPFVPASGASYLAYVSLKGAEKVFAGAARPMAQVMAEAEKPNGAAPRFDLPWRLEAELSTEVGEARSANVAALIQGSDPILRDEVVVLSAHLDHMGLGAPEKGDGVYNGAIDNAGGVATLLEVARGFAQAARPPRRSILILALTAEEKGLVGSEYFTHNRPASIGTLVADVNLDMPLLTHDFRDVVAFGAERSTIGPAAARAAGRVGLRLVPDPMPDQGLFTRSDHYRFVEQGVPSVFFMTGPGNGGMNAFRDFLANRYHQPDDDMRQPIDFRAAARFAQVNYELARELADADERPAWKAGDFFGTLFAPR